MTQQMQQDPGTTYIQAFETLRFGQSCCESGDCAGELFALKHTTELIQALLNIMGAVERFGQEGDDGHAVELDGVREMPRAIPDFPEAEAQKEEGASQTHVVPLVQGNDASSGEILTEQEPEASKHGLTGINPKRGLPPRRFRLYRLDDEGEIVETVDEGTAAELANRNNIGPSTVYKLAGRAARKGRQWHVEKVEG